MYRFLRSLWIWAASVALILLWVPLLAAVWLGERDPRKLRTGRWFRRLGRAVAKVNPWRIHISGVQRVDPDRVYVIVSNHQSLADIPVISHLLVDAKWLAKAELFRLPAMGWMLRMAGDIPVDRRDRRSTARALLECGRCLRQRCSVVFFPEGTRSPDGNLRQFADGPFQLAIREQVAVLPLVVNGSGAALPRNSWIFGPTQDIYLHVLEPVRTDNLQVKDTRDLQMRVRELIASELDRLRSGSSD
jgi:1-acyl-sn-glycerol-3-phosphate acyltransferase